MSQERPFGNSGVEHHPEPNHPQPTEEATVTVPTPNRFWRMMTDHGFPSPASNPASFVVTAEAFLGLTSQVQALAGMVQTIVRYLPQLVVEARTTSPIPTPARSQSRSCDPIQTEPDLDTLSSDTTDSLREQVRQVHQRLDKVQKEVLKPRGEVRKSSKGGSPFTPEIQAKPLPATFRLPALEPYDGSGDPTEHITAFHAQMALYDTSDALMWMAQGSDEPLSQFMGQFTSQVQGIPYLHPSLAIQAFLTGLRSSRFFWSLIERPPTTLPEMLQWAHQYVAAETLVAGKREETETKHPRGEQSHLIRRDHLRRYVREQSSLPDGRPPRDSSPQPKGPVEKQIDVIFGGPASGGNSSSARKAYVRSEVGKRPLHDEDLDVTFKSGGEERPCHDDALLISVRMANAYVKRVMSEVRPTFCISTPFKNLD
ncbi:hypothetical protein BHE74_00044279 [Ensete ventricosum]|nr:hypothetical protein BHE74_00044279 [Ensete ventricosum]